MGLLDDAIREHLELKRRHGASDEEIAQEEAEALGPARREFPAPAAEPQAEVQSAELPSAEEPEALPDEPAPMGLEPELAEPEQAFEPEPALEPEPETEAMREPQPEPEFKPQPEPEREPETRDSMLDTQEHEAQPEEPPRDGDDDVLEETPEFLQDAPEHDRLWFEQKPPRDFDFD